MKKLHPNLGRAVLKTLEAIFSPDRAYADKAIEKTLRSNPKWGSRDRSFIASSVYDIVRWKRLLQEGARVRGTAPEDIEKMASLHWAFKDFDVQAFISKAPTHKQAAASINKASGISPAVRFSVPDWLYEMGKTELKGKWDRELEHLNAEADVVLRANTLKTTTTQLQKLLEVREVATKRIPDAPDALILEERANVFRFPEFKAGFFEIQDTSSQMVAPFLQAEPGMRVIDACAGAGGKSLHLAALMKNSGKILSLDVEDRKLAELQKRARRAGISCIETRLITGSKTIKRLKESADRLLLDVPCSGLGVLRRNPDAKWKLTPEFINEVRETQALILESYSKMVKPGGKLVYATCSILPSENNLQVEKFLSRHPEFKLEEEKSMLVSEAGSDGFYMARIRRQIS